MSDDCYFVFFDGTDCSEADGTNISKLKNTVRTELRNKTYKAGIGQNRKNFFKRLIHKAGAPDLDDTAVEVYREMQDRGITKKNRVYIFGYSRGAILARCLAQILTNSNIRDQVTRQYDFNAYLDLDVEFVGLFDPVLGYTVNESETLELQVASNPRVVNYVELLSLDESRRVYASHSGLKVLTNISLRGGELDPNRGEVSVPKQFAQFQLRSVRAKVDRAERQKAFRKFIWMPGGHSDVGGGVSGDIVLANHAYLTMLEHFVSAAEVQNTEIELEGAALQASLDTIIQNFEVKVVGNARFWSRFFSRRRPLQSGYPMYLHAFFDQILGRKGVRRDIFFWKYRQYDAPKLVKDLPRQSDAYVATRALANGIK